MRVKPGIAISLVVVATVAAVVLVTGPFTVRATGDAVAATPVIATAVDAATSTAAAPNVLTVPPSPVAEAAVKRYHRTWRPRVLTLSVTGDILLHEPVSSAAQTADGGHDFRPMLAPIAPLVTASDLALCHLEVPLSPDGLGLSGYPVFNAPPQLATAIAATGYDGCSTASNHSLDQRPAGVSATLDVLDAAGVGHAGTARSAAEDAAPRLYRAGRLVVGHVSATYGLNGFVMPAEQPWLVDVIDPVAGVLAEASAARAAGAAIVVVSVHWGDEYRTEPSEYQRAVAAELAASPDVDLIVGHHAHVVQPVEWMGDTAVVFGLGNLLSGQQGRHTAGTQDGVVVTVTITDTPTTPPKITNIGYVPTWVEPISYRVLIVTDELADPSLSPDRRSALEASLARTGDAIGPAAQLNTGS